MRIKNYNSAKYILNKYIFVFFNSNFGLSPLVETEWLRLNVPCVLRTFWLLRVAEHAGAMFYNGWSLADTPWPFLLSSAKSLLISGCETLTAVLGMTSVISYVCHYIGCFFQWVRELLVMILHKLFSTIEGLVKFNIVFLAKFKLCTIFATNLYFYTTFYLHFNTHFRTLI